MQMYLFTRVDANGGDVAGIVYHEITHGLACRLIVERRRRLRARRAPVEHDERGLGGLLLHRPAGGGRRPDGHGGAGGAQLAQHVFPAASAPSRRIARSTRPARRRRATGIRPAGARADTPTPTSRTTNNICGPHNGGEVWAETLWDLRTAVGRDAALKLVAGGMRLTPDNPSFLDARDAILRQAAAMRTAPGAPDDYFAQAWDVFRVRGMGFDATTANADSTTPTESYAAPGNAVWADPMTVTDAYPGGDNDGKFEPGERVSVSAPFFSPGLADLPGLTGSLSSADPGVTIVSGTATWGLLGNGRTARTRRR